FFRDAYPMPTAPASYDQTVPYQPNDYARMGQQQQMSPRDQLAVIVGHLNNAERIVETQGPQAAMGEYGAAIQAADQVDQRAVMQYRAMLQRQIATEQNPQARMALMQQDMDLHALQRAPGFTRANVGLLLERSGDQKDGIMLLMQASARD